MLKQKDRAPRRFWKNARRSGYGDEDGTRVRLSKWEDGAQVSEMKEWLILLTENAVVVIDLMALLVVFYGTAEAFLRALRLVFAQADAHRRHDIWLRFARWLVAGLTFQLAADIIETSISTDWEAVGRIAAVAVVRTFLNYFLERDVSEVRERSE